MCGRASLTVVEADLEKRFDASFYTEDLERYRPLPSFNIAPTHWHPVVPQEDSKHYCYHRWGLIPFWAKDASIGSKMINARAETLMEKPAFRKAFQSRRCLVPMDGFYEWRRDAGGKKIPMRIRLKGGGVFFMAGLSDHWRDPAGGQTLASFTIITCPANKVVAPLHDRMPVILMEQEEEWWIDPHLRPEQALAMLKPFPDKLLEAYRVSDRVNSVRNNDPHLIDPVETSG
ncbi:MAG: putative SOS response-associated peptidase YedK [Saprospiraceae bacterium]|nr:putative SOS response-associated peptidase YedK [Saprospiraceae bacterium]